MTDCISAALDNAIAGYNQAITLTPQNAEAYYGRGYSYFLVGESELAMDDLMRALELGLNPIHKQVTQKLLDQLQQSGNGPTELMSISKETWQETIEVSK